MYVHTFYKLLLQLKRIVQIAYWASVHVSVVNNNNNNNTVIFPLQEKINNAALV